MEWCETHPNTVIYKLPTDEWDEVDKWRCAVAEHTAKSFSVAHSPRVILRAINEAVDLFGTEVLNDIQVTHDEL